MDAEVIGQWLREVLVPGLLSLLFAAGSALAWKYIGRMEESRIREILEELVRAAEQMFGEGEGDRKLAFVWTGLDQRRVRGVTRPQIEAAVNTLYPKFDVWPAPDADGEGG